MIPTVKRQYLYVIRVDAEDSEPDDYFLNQESGTITLDLQTLSRDNHEVIEWEEITNA
jgi:hypothetical protein